MNGDVVVVEDDDLQEPSAAVWTDVENPVTVQDGADGVSYGVVNVVVVNAMLAGTVSNLHVQPARPSTYLDPQRSTTLP